ncbi:hypothetical protein L9F63_001345 [Diploptera punctata]|uniref:Ionotropic glutamate receptor C-terminal domain-containing protein n=1 Tax=Diploptera punctata TaxID=6984 RepID=A0AAD8A451_DIPPU|nr:hypothetical protein L9F63_001345 [Diploptera punctata]
MKFLAVILCLFFTYAEPRSYYMGKCIKEISAKHFKPGTNLIISIARPIFEKVLERNIAFNEDGPMAENLIGSFKEFFPLLVFSSNKSNLHNMTCHLGTVTYIFILNHYFYNVSTSLYSQLENLRYTNCLHPRAYFLIVYSGVKIKTNDEVLMKDIFVELRKWNIINAVLMVEDTLSAYVSKDKDVEIFNLYSWFPYRGPGVCSQVNDIIKVNSCFNGVLQHNVPLFSTKIPNNLYGCPIIAGVVSPIIRIERPNELIDVNITESWKYFESWEIKLWQLLAHSLNLTDVYNQSSWIFFKNGTAAGLKDDVISHRVDVGFGGWPLLHRNLKVLDPTIPVLRNELVWLVPCAQVRPRWTGIFKVFSVPVWVVGSFVTTVTAALLYFLARNSHEVYTSFHRCFMNFFAVLLGISVQVMPNKADLRIVFLSWIIFSMCINTVFQTYLTTFLTQPSFQHQINSLEELLTSGIEFGYTKAEEVILKYFDDSRANEIKQRHKDTPWIGIAGNVSLIRIAYERDFCMLFSKPGIKLILTNSFLDEKGEPLICVMDETFYDSIDVYYLQKGHPLLGRINSMIRRVLEAGLVDFMIRMDMEKLKVHAAVRGVHRFGDDYCDLSIQHMRGVLFILLVGNAMAILAFVTEIIYSYAWTETKYPHKKK